MTLGYTQYINSDWLLVVIFIKNSGEEVENMKSNVHFHVQFISVHSFDTVCLKT